MAESGSLSLIQGEEPNKVKILFLPCGSPYSLTLQGHCLPSHSCLCLLYLFGADYIMGSCLIFPDWPEWLLMGVTFTHTCHPLLWQSYDTVLEPESPGWPSWSQKCTGLPALEQPNPVWRGHLTPSGSSRFSLLLISKCFFTRLVQGNCLDLRNPQKGSVSQIRSLLCDWPSIKNRMT